MMKGQLKSHLENQKVSFRKHPKDYSLNTKLKLAALFKFKLKQDLDPFSPYHISDETNSNTI